MPTLPLKQPPAFATTRPAVHSPTRTPLESERLTEILEVAAEIFIAQGFDAASTNEIARRANASKTTFYSRFPTKELLFARVIEYRMEQVFYGIAPTLPLDAPLPATLRDFASAILRAALSPRHISLIRMMSMESRRFPALAQRFYELGAARGKAFLAQYLAQQATRGKFRPDDPELMAEHFISLVIGGPIHWYILGFSPALPSRERRIEHVEAAVSAFLRAYASAPADVVTAGASPRFSKPDASREDDSRSEQR